MDETERTEEIARGLLHLMPRFHRWAVAAAEADRHEQDPTLRQLSVLEAVQNGVASPVQLARLLRVNRAVVTGLLDRMEQRGLVRREPDPADRRRLRIVVTVEGAAACHATERSLVRQLAEQLTATPAADLEAAQRTLRLLGEAVAALEARTPLPADSDPEDDED